MVVDEDVDVQNVREVAWKALNNIDPERDIQFVMGPVDSLDHASRLPNYGSKMGVDATKKWPGEGFTRPWPDVIRMSDEVRSSGGRALEEGWAGLSGFEAANVPAEPRNSTRTRPTARSILRGGVRSEIRSKSR